jgi:hypothetical protein
VFGLVIDGQRKSISFPSMEDAEAAAPQGQQAEIFDMVTSKIVKQI